MGPSPGRGLRTRSSPTDGGRREAQGATPQGPGHKYSVAVHLQEALPSFAIS